MRSFLLRLVLLLSVGFPSLHARAIPFAFLSPKASRQTYFGNCQADGSAPVGYATTWYGGVLFYATPPSSPSSVQGVQEWTCPGTGPQTVNSIEFLGWLRSAGGKVRIAIYEYASQSSDGGTIYDYTLNKVVEHSAAVALSGSSGTPAWVGGAQGLTGTTTLQGGKRYIVGIALDSGNAGYAYTATGNAMSQLTGDYTGGLPNPLSGGGANNSDAPVFRVSITGNGSSPAAALFEDFFVVTDTGATTNNGGPTTPYKYLQDVLVARTNKTFTKPIRIFCSGATADTKAVSDFSLGQFAPTLANQLYIIGDRTAHNYDTSKYRLEPTDRTSYYGAINFAKNYVNIDRLQVKLPSTTAAVANEIVYVGNNSPGTFTFSNGIVVAPGGSDITRYFSSANESGGLNIYNTLMYGMGTGASGSGLKLHGTTRVSNSVIIANGGDGVNNTDGSTVYLRNVYIQSTNGAGTIAGTGLSTENLNNVATSDSDGSTGLRNIPFSTATFNNVTSGFEDFRLANGSALISPAGSSNSGDPSPMNFTTDLIGVTLSSPPDIGALKK